MGSPLKREKDHRVTQTEVQRYIMAHLMPQCVSKPLPVHERELARTLKVNRLTVHRAVTEFLSKGLMIQIPGRRGLFLNPECQGSRYCEQYFGILWGQGDIPVLNSFLNLILKGFFEAVRQNNYIDCQFLTLTTKSPERVAAEIRSYPLHALFWFSPSPEFHPVIDQLLEQGLPVVVINSVTDSRILPYKSNTFLLDYAQQGVLLAEKALENSFRKILFAGLRSVTLDNFRSVMTEHRIDFSMRDFMEYSPENHDPKKLVALIRKRKIDMVVSNGKVYQDLEKILKLSDLSGVTFLLGPLRRVVFPVAEHPECRILLPDYSFNEALERMGRAIAEKISGSSPVLRFRNEIIPLKESSDIKS